MMLYEGKAKQVFSTDVDGEYLIHFKDDATAFNGEKKEVILGKGELNLAITTLIFDLLKESGIKTHHIKTINERDMIVKKVTILPLEVIVRNISAGSFSKRLGVEEGIVFEEPVFELSYKNDDLGDPLINQDHAVALKLVTREQLAQVKETTLEINNILKKFFDKANLILVDFKIEFGVTDEGEILLADEISPDTCRLWDKDTKEKFDKDLFRRNLGSLTQGYEEVLKRLRG